MTEQAPNPSRDLTEARERLAGVAAGLAQLFGPLQAGQLLLGAVIGVLGPENAATLMAAVAEEIELGDCAPTPPSPARSTKPN